MTGYSARGGVDVMGSHLDKADLAVLSSMPLFSGLSTKELEQLLAHAPARRYKARTVLIENGDSGNAFYAVLEGRVRVYAEGDDDKEVTLNELDAGQYFGELALIRDTTRCASAATITDSRLLVLSKPDFVAFLSSSPEVALRMIHELAERVGSLTRDVQRFALRDVYGRLVDALNQRAKDENGRRVTDPITQQELANLVGSSREMINRIFKELKAGDYITLDGRRVILKKKLPDRW